MVLADVSRTCLVTAGQQNNWWQLTTEMYTPRGTWVYVEDGKDMAEGLIFSGIPAVACLARLCLRGLTGRLSGPC